MFDEYRDIDIAFEAVFTAALEASHVLSTKERNALPDDCFGLIYTNNDGKRVRAYPLKVPGDPKKTQELVEKSLSMFHYCIPSNKPKLAKRILEVIEECNLSVTISTRNMIIAYIDKNNLPKGVKILNTH